VIRKEYARSRPVRTVTNSLPFWKRWLGFSPVQREYVRLTKAQVQSLTWQSRFRVVSNIVQNLSAALQTPIAFDGAQFMNHYTNQLALPLPLLKPDPLQIARFQEQANNPRGLDLDVQPLRHYPGRTTNAHLLGFLVRDNRSMMDENAFFNYRLQDFRGRIGIEGLFDDELRGKAGVKSVLVNSLGYRQSEQVWAEAEPGKNVVLTIDSVVQNAAMEALQSHGPDTRGAVVVLDLNNGDVLALASSPAYDPNVFIQGISRSYAEWLSDPQLRPQINRALQENYAPGSIFKIVTSMACLETGMDPKAKIYNPPNPYNPNRGIIYVGRRAIDDLAPPGEYDFRRGFIRSSNTYFITNGMRAGIEEIIKIGQRLRFGERTGLLPGQESPGYWPSLRMVRTGWHPGETANICFGQGKLAVTPLQMAVMVAAVANGGKVLWPRIVDRVEPQGPHLEDEVRRFPHQPVRDHLGVSPRTLQLIRDAMLADVEDKEEGLGRLAYIPGFRICGKTGTAQVMDSKNQIIDHTTWFASFAPYEQPRYVVIVMVEGGTSGGGTCAPLAKTVYKALLEQEGKKANALAQLN